MQVDRKTHRWPLVVALVGLLAFCLTVPRYWRSVDRPLDGDAQVRGIEAQPQSSNAVSPTAKSPVIPLTLEDLIAAHRAPALPSFSADEALFVRLSASFSPSTPLASFPSATWPAPADVLAVSPIAEAASIEVGSRVVVVSDWVESQLEVAMGRVGRNLARHSPPPVTTPWIDDAAELLGVWMSRWSVARGASVTRADSAADPAADAASPLPAILPIEAAPSTTLRLVDPRPRMAMLEPQVVTDPSEMRILAPQPIRDVASNLESAVWSSPDVLLAQIEHLTHYPHSERWALDTLGQLRALVDGDRRDRAQAAALLAALSNSSAEAVALADAAGDGRLRVALLRAHWGIERRLDCWTVMRDIRIASISGSRFAARDTVGNSFRGWSSTGAAQHQLESISADLESYERFRDPHVARKLAQAQRQLRYSTSDLDRALADAVEENYRNANVRVAVTAEMINRFLSQDRVQTRPVHERIAGTPVRGQSETVSRSQVTFQPAVGFWQMQMQTEGVVESETASVGSARVYTNGSTQFTAQTPIAIGSNGVVETRPTAVIADNHSQLTGVATGIDWIPIVGSIARNQVIQQYEKKRPRAKSEIEFKVANRTREQVDAHASEMVSDIRRQFNDRLTAPLARYGIEIAPLEMTTTNERIVARLRIASADQLAAHTPRPRALSDSLVSMQIHESALTNGAVALELNGERLTGTQLQARLREKLARLALEQPPKASDDTVFQFAPADTVRFRVDGGRLELALAISEFSQQNVRIRNFIVHAFYVPVVNGLTAELVRDGSLGIEGAIGSADRARLHNVFRVVLSEERRLPIFRLEDPNDPRLDGLMITQLVLEDGWLGLSIGPAVNGRMAQQQRSLR